MATYGHGLSGGDRIWIEISKKLAEKFSVNVYLWEEGLAIAKREGLKKVNFILWSARKAAKLGFFINYFIRVWIGIHQSLRLNLENSPKTIIYSASEFWQDSIPALILKIRFPKIKWVAAWYQTAPNPLNGFTEGRRDNKHYLSAFLYWLVQFPVKPLVTKYADLILVNNENERSQFKILNQRAKVMVMLGAIDLKKINSYRQKHSSTKKLYDGVFQGRFHPQKGVVELVSIWRIVVDSKPDAKLAMIGDGPLMESVKLKIKSEKLQKNIKLFGYLFDGEEKYKIFSQSKVVLHPAFFDSGGMASLEAMAFGVPVVGFDLKAYNSYYPKGMTKVRVGDIKAFANQVLLLLNNHKISSKITKEGLKMLETNWSWEVRAKSLLKFINR